MGSCYSTICVSNTDREAKVVAAARSGRWKGTLKNNGIDSSFLGRSEALNEVELHRIPGRMFSSGASNLACLFTQQGKKGTNQDAMLVWENFISRSDTVFCGVFDGHGPYGHIVAKKVRDSLPLLLHMQWKAYSNNEQSSPYNNVIVPDGNTITVETASISTDDELYEAGKDEENEKLPKLYFPLRQSMLNAFMLMDKELKLHPGIDCFCSGSTAVTLIKKGQDLVIGNVGDSRAILATRDNDNSLIAVQLTVDLKPNLPREAARIQQCKGRVFALQDEPEVARVWLPNSNSPGLAMARAFGDFCLKDFGLISVPEIYYHRLTERDQFIVLATDGIWDVLSNKEVVDIVASAPGQTTAARALVDSATRAWRLKYPTSKIDDCAAVCLFLNDLHRRVVGERVVVDEAVGRVDVGRNSNASRASDDIVPVSDPADIKSSGRFHGQSRRSLAECISTAEQEEWSALEGITRVNSLLSIPRFLSGDRRSLSWRRWL